MKTTNKSSHGTKAKALVFVLVFSVIATPMTQCMAQGAYSSRANRSTDSDHAADDDDTAEVVGEVLLGILALWVVAEIAKGNVVRDDSTNDRQRNDDLWRTRNYGYPRR